MAVLVGSVSPENRAAAGRRGDVSDAQDVDRRLGGVVAINFLAPAFNRVGGFVESFRRGNRAAVHLN